MIDEAAIEKLVEDLLNNSGKAGELRGERVYAEEYRKSLKAILASQSNESSEAAKERAAYKHQKYLDHLEELKKAVTADEGNRAWRAGAEIAIESWRTMEANKRSVKL